LSTKFGTQAKKMLQLK